MHIQEEPQRIVPPHAWVGHIPFAMWLVEELRPASVVELGVHSGNSFFAMCQSAQQAQLDCVLHGIDTWEGEKHAGQYDDSVWLDVSSYARSQYPESVRLHRCLFDEALKSFGPGSVDLLHIDGLHTYDAVKHDFDTWLPTLSQRGIVLFHDTAEHREDFGVHLLWAELKLRYPSLEFNHSHGLGVLFVGPDAQPVHALLSTPGRFSPLAYFERAGKGLMARVEAPTRSGAQAGGVAHAVMYLGSEVPAEYSEENSLKADVSFQGVTSLYWSLPNPVTALRFDPSNAPCSMEVRRFDILDAQDQVLWSLQGPADLDQVSDLIVLDQSLRAGVRLQVVCTGTDPQFKLRLPASLLPLPPGTQLRLELEAGPVLVASALLGWQNATQAMAQVVQQSLQTHQQLHAQWQQERAGLQAQCSALQENVTSLVQRNARLELESRTVSHQLDHARQLRGFRLLRFLNPKTFRMPA